MKLIKSFIYISLLLCLCISIVNADEVTLYYVEGTTNTLTTSVTFVDLAEMSITIPYEIGQIVKIHFSCNVEVWGFTDYTLAYFRMLRNSTQICKSVIGEIDAGDLVYIYDDIDLLAIDTPNISGNCTYKIQWSTMYGSQSIRNYVDTDYFFRILTVEVFSKLVTQQDNSLIGIAVSIGSCLLIVAVISEKRK